MVKAALVEIVLFGYKSIFTDIFMPDNRMIFIMLSADILFVVSENSPPAENLTGIMNDFAMHALRFVAKIRD